MNETNQEFIHCRICNAPRNNQHYCPDCGFSYASLQRLRLRKLWTDQSGFYSACAPTGCTECDCCTLEQTPRHLRSKPKPVQSEPAKSVQAKKPAQIKNIKTVPKVDAGAARSEQPLIQPEKSPKPRRCCLAGCAFGIIGFIGSVIKALLKLLKIIAIIAFIGFLIYLLVFWMEHQ